MKKKKESLNAHIMKKKHLEHNIFLSTLSIYFIHKNELILNIANDVLFVTFRLN